MCFILTLPLHITSFLYAICSLGNISIVRPKVMFFFSGGPPTVVINMVRNASVSIVILAYVYISPCKIMVVMEYIMNLITIQLSLSKPKD